MKTFICALLLLSLAVAFIVTNSFVTRSITDKLSDRARALPVPDGAGEGEKALEELTGLWDKKRCWIFATAKNIETEKIEECFVLLRAAYETSALSEFAAAKLSLLEAFSALEEAAGFKLYNLF